MNSEVHQYDTLLYTSPAVSQPHLDSPMSEPSWRPHQSPENGSSGHSSHIYGTVNQASHGVGDYTSTSTAFLQNNSPDAYVHTGQSPLLHSNPSGREMFSQIEGSIGPSRVQTRRQRAAQMAAVQHGPRRDSISVQPSMPMECHENTEVG
jgi:hypothetical protein